ncbi:MAG: amidohydrolase [Planctomycetota bacterium]|jgi:amidohydrolase|nr:amidohydrolase [Planctomycetota bacterium]MDP6762428.1 amidohydrolase [Planctomycetota bacterium]MDP6988725.1 amidohydrolase [Planctomycetota bacterium]
MLPAPARSLRPAALCGASLLLLLAGRAPAADPDDLRARLERAVAESLEATVAWRRDIHAHPELGEREERTASLVARQLESLGLEVRTGVGGTGVVALLRGGRPGALCAWRADMDALPVTEATGLPYASRVTDEWGGAQVGVMHACGHDVHTAVALGAATVLARKDVRERLRGAVLFLFQPAEEGHPGPGLHGAARMLAEGAFEPHRPEAVFGLHVSPSLPVGSVAAMPGGVMAAVDRLKIEVHGRQAHGAYPEDGVDPIVAASGVVLALQTIASRTVSTHERVVVTIGKFDAGNRFNIIPATAELLGTVRTHDEGVQERVHRRIREVAEGTAAAMGARAEVTIERVTPVTVNDPELLVGVRASLARVVGEEHLRVERPHMGGEDFAFFAREVPGCYFFLGTTLPGTEPPGRIHTPTFAPDEGAIEVGLRCATGLVADWLEAHAP